MKEKNDFCILVSWGTPENPAYATKPKHTKKPRIKS